jgi:hypothetical protein
MVNASDRLKRAIALFRAENSQDPKLVLDRGAPRPRELVDAERLVVWVARLEPDASEALTLASHCQHLRRWESPRESYEPGRIGYLKWRKDLARFHADNAVRILREAGYDSDVIEAVRAINLKQGLRTNPDVQTMEDALCLSFLEHELEEFAQKHPDDKVVDIIAKTWRKMSERAQMAALKLPLPGHARRLVEHALHAPASSATNASPSDDSLAEP